MITLFRQLYLSSRFFAILAMTTFFFVLSYFFPAIFLATQWLCIGLFAVLLLDIWLLFRTKESMFGLRHTPEKLSNGDANPLQIYLENRSGIDFSLKIIDETPIQFQLRDLLFEESLKAGQKKTLQYHLRPIERGEYQFGALNVFAQTALGLASRRFRFSQDKTVAVYPSFMQMYKYELIAISNRLQEFGVKKIRKLGSSMEFEQIRNYVQGDDYRDINWRATARRNDLMVNQYEDEKSQSVYCLIDKGRVMKMPFEQLSLLDYAINATLVVSNIAIKKGDKAGLLSFAETPDPILSASKQGSQMRLIQERLYREKTRFLETDYEKVFVSVRRGIAQRSLLLLFTNFETLHGLNRQLPYLRRLAKHHLLVVIFFENTELRQLLDTAANDLETVYQKTIAEKFNYEKRQIVKELQAHGILAMLTDPHRLIIDTINKYLEIKARRLL